MVERSLQVAEGDVGIDAEPFELMEDGRVGRVRRVVAVHLAGADDAHRRRRLFHGADLHRRGMGAQQQAVALRRALLLAMNSVSWVSRAGWLGGKFSASKL